MSRRRQSSGGIEENFRGGKAMTVQSTAVETEAAAGSMRWGQLACGIVCMVMIANLQYGWTLFVNPINKAHGWSIASIQFAFAIFIALETWLTPIEGWIVDVLGPQRGPKLMVAFGGGAAAISLGSGPRSNKASTKTIAPCTRPNQRKAVL